MEEFLKTNYSFLTKFFEFIAAITAILCYKKYKNTTIKYFIYFLVYVALIEFVGGIPGYVEKYDFLFDIKEKLKGTIFEKNYWWYTISWNIGAPIFYSFYFRKILKDNMFINTLKFTSFLFLVSSIIFIVLNLKAFFISSFPFINIFGTLMILLCVVFYFIEFLKSDEILIFYKSINFIVSTTIFLWWLVITPLVFYQIYYSKADWDFVILRWQIYLFANICMYLTFTFALIWCKPEND